MNNKEYSCYYGDVLSPDEIQIVGRILGNYCDREINYTDFQNKLASIGIEVKPNFIDESKFKNQKQLEEFKERVAKNNILPTDALSFTLSSKNYNNVILSYDRLMLETLASIGDPVATETLNRLISWESAHRGSRR